MALGRRALSKLSQHERKYCKTGQVWQSSTAATERAGATTQNEQDSTSLGNKEGHDIPSKLGGGSVIPESSKKGNLAGPSLVQGGGKNISIPSPSCQRKLVASWGGSFSGNLAPPLLHRAVSLNNLPTLAHIHVRHSRTDGDHSHHFNHGPPFRPLSERSPHEYRGLSSETPGISTDFGTHSVPPPANNHRSLSTPPPHPTPEGAKRTLLYGALAALLLSGGAAIVANGDVTPGKVLNTDPRAVMRSASQSMREAAHEAQRRARFFSDAVAERWEELSAATSAMTSSAGALASCLLTVLWGPLEGVEDVHSRGRSLLRARVAALIADFAANRERRNAIARTGEGKILRWLLEQVSRPEPAVRHEAARALGHFLDDRRTAGAVLAQRGAVPQLLVYCDMLPRVQMLPPTRDWDLEGEDLEHFDRAPPGQRLLVASLSKLVAGPDVSTWTRFIRLSPDAEPDDIASALQEMRSFERDVDDSEAEEFRKRGVGGRGGGGVQGIGIRVLGDTSIVGVQRALEGSERVSSMGGGDSFDRHSTTDREREERRSSNSQASSSSCKSPFSDQPADILYRGVLAESLRPDSQVFIGSAAASAPGDRKPVISRRELPIRSGPTGLGSFLLGGESSPALDEINLGGQLATWAVATWAAESRKNREQIAQLDSDGGALEAALRHPDPSVQFHASRAVELLAKDEDKWPESAAATWTPPLLGMLASTLFHDPALPSRLSPGGLSSLAATGAEALGACARRSPESRKWLGTQGLGVLRRLAADERLGGAVQRPLASLVELLGQGELDKNELKLWVPILLKWASSPASPPDVRSSAIATLQRSIEILGPDGKLVMEAWLATLLSLIATDAKKGVPKPADPHGLLQSQAVAAAKSALTQLEKVMAQQTVTAQQSVTAPADVGADVAPEKRGWFGLGAGKKSPPKPVAEADVLLAVSNALKALAEVIAEDGARQLRVLDAGAYALLTQFLRSAHFGATVSTQQWQSAQEGAGVTKENGKQKKPPKQKRPYVKRHALRVLANLSIHPQLGALLGGDQALVNWLEEVADGRVPAQKGDLKLRSYAKETLLHLAFWKRHGVPEGAGLEGQPFPRYLDGVYLFDPTAPHFRTCLGSENCVSVGEAMGRTTEASDAVSNGTDGSPKLFLCEVARDGEVLAATVSTENVSKLPTGDGLRSPEESRGEASRSVDVGTVLGQEGVPESEGTSEGARERAVSEGGDSVDKLQRSSADEGSGVAPKSDTSAAVTSSERSDSFGEVPIEVGKPTGSLAPSSEDQGTIVGPGAEAQFPDGRASTESNAHSVRKSEAEGASGDRPPSQISAHYTPLEEVSSPQMAPGDPPEPVMDVVFIHGLMGGAYKTWRMTDDKTSALKAGGVVEDLREEERPREGDGCWPTDWLAKDLPNARLLSTEYKTNLTEWSGATLPLQDLSAHLLDKLVAAGIGERPVVFVTHSLGGLVAKQMLQLVQSEEKYRAVRESIRGIVFYSCPHFGSRLADLPSRMGVVLRPAAAVGELRSGSPRLEELNKLLKKEYQKGRVDVINFSEDKVTPVMEAYYGVKLRMEVVAIESAYPGFGDLIVLKGTDHVNACKPLNRQDVAYTKTLEFLRKLAGVEAAEKVKSRRA